jgi:hypothetical protein
VHSNGRHPANAHKTLSCGANRPIARFQYRDGERPNPGASLDNNQDAFDKGFSLLPGDCPSSQF